MQDVAASSLHALLTADGALLELPPPPPPPPMGLALGAIPILIHPARLYPAYQLGPYYNSRKVHCLATLKIEAVGSDPPTVPHRRIWSDWGLPLPETTSPMRAGRQAVLYPS